jgi:ribosome-dependent ATPase
MFGVYIFKLRVEDAKMDAVQAEGITKRFGDFQAVDRASFSVKKGEVFGFLGPNGAG